MIRQSMSKFITFSPRQLAVLFSTLLILPVLLYVVFQQQFYAWYLTTYAAPRLEKELGFKTDWVPYTAGNGERYEAFVITEVTPGGIFDRAGFKAGDMPGRYAHSIEAGFFGELQDSRSHGPVEIVVVPLKPTLNHAAEGRTIRVRAPETRSN